MAIGRGASGLAAVSDLRRTRAREVIEGSAEAVRACLEIIDDIVRVGELIGTRLAAGGKLLICGNGGSAADAQHFAAELVGRFTRERAPVAAIALTTDSSILTAVSNDYAFDDVFARQVQALARPGDVLVAISTSGNSENVLRAFAAAPRDVLKVSLSGTTGSLNDMADVALRVPGSAAWDVQAGHAATIHALCAVVESGLA